jgi:hypothetical protein
MENKTIQPSEHCNNLTPDQAAECLDGISRTLGNRLWEVLTEHGDKTRMQGTFSAGTNSEGFAETPDQLWDTDGKYNSIASFWGKFTESEQLEINAAMVKEYGE